jgi:hypothetical protein
MSIFTTLPDYDSWLNSNNPAEQINWCEENGCDDKEPWCDDCASCRKHCKCNQDVDDDYYNLSDRLYDEWRERQ